MTRIQIISSEDALEPLARDMKMVPIGPEELGASVEVGGKGGQ